MDLESLAKELHGEAPVKKGDGDDDTYADPYANDNYNPR